jgi:hypothetical protein
MLRLPDAMFHGLEQEIRGETTKLVVTRKTDQTCAKELVIADGHPPRAPHRQGGPARPSHMACFFHSLSGSEGGAP